MTEQIDRHTASSGKVDYSKPVIVHDTRASQIEFVPIFVSRTAGDEMSFKLVRTNKRAKPWPETTTINVPAEAALRLQKALGAHFAVASQDSGSYIVVRADGGADLDGLSVEAMASAVRQLLSADPEVTGHLVQQDLGAEILHALKTDIRLKELRGAVAELANHLREGQHLEAVYQAWCNQHSWAFGNAYVVNDHIRSISATDQVDLLLPRNLGGFRDLIELKRPDMDIIRWDVSHKNWYWTSETSKAIGQCHRYLDVLHNDVADGRLRDAPNVIAYHPRATIVIGRSAEWGHEQHKALHGLNRRLSDMSVITYDHLLAQARATLALVEAPEPQAEVVVPSEDLF